jgi:hypothetical protein
MFPAAIVQMTSTPGPEANWTLARRLVERAACYIGRDGAAHCALRSVERVATGRLAGLSTIEVARGHRSWPGN